MTTYGLTAEAVEKIQRVLDHLTEHPDEHKQGTWLEKVPPKGLESADVAACGTVGCFAGHLSLIGNKIPDEAWIPFYADHPTIRFWAIDFSEFSVTDAAERALGIDIESNPEAYHARDYLDRMFDGDRTIYQLWHMGQELTEGRLRIPEGLEKSADDYDDELYCSCCC